jgi:hypothetical protein
MLLCEGIAIQSETRSSHKKNQFLLFSNDTKLLKGLQEI